MKTRSRTPPGMSYTPSYANDEHRRIAAAALRLSRLHPPGSVSSSGAPEPDGAVRVPQAAYILDAGCVDVPVDIEVVDADAADAADAHADTDRDAEDWRRIKMLAAGSTDSTEGSQLRTDLLSHSHSHSLSHSRRSHQSHRSRLSQQSGRHSSQVDRQDGDDDDDDDDNNNNNEEDEDEEYEEEDYEEADEDEPEPGCSHENAFFVLLRISFCLPPFTIFAALYAFISLIFLLLAIPLRLCPPSHFFKPPTSLTEQVCRLLVPLLRLNRRTVTSPTSTRSHRRSNSHQHRQSRHHGDNHHAKRSRRHYSTHSSLPASALTSPRQSYTISTSTPVSASLSSSTIPTQLVTATDSASTPASTTTTNAAAAAAASSPSRLYPNYSAPMLVVVHLLSPLLLPPTLLAAWICACFWIFVMIMGNPDGKEKTDDGRAAVLAVRNWWCLWLASARRKRRKRDPEAGSV
ncbi:hypothetical protein H105_06052 [Trichophyton soudanense CBS 452.61]|uniref:Uncharacterized protein n=1 Tax=Trichophyton soudanense CBS 452.61 TaxID=1215331 RepID=A0A022XM82_TRISD|nr:hypothetical protein H105_06052 [Trichophyton soudanense CBS 452.61]